jgi:hypothetical protein
VNKGLVAVLAVVVLGLLAGAAVPVAERYAAQQIKAEIERDGQASVGAVEVGLIDRRVTLVDLRSHAFGEATVGRWQASGLSESLGDLLRGRTPLSDFKLGDPLQADHVELVDARMIDPSSGAGWNVGSLVIDRLDLASYDANAPGPHRVAILTARIAKALSVQRIEGKNAAYTFPETGDAISARRVAVDGFSRGRIGALRVADLEVAPRASTEVAFKIDEIKAKDVELGRVLAQLGDTSWRPGRPLGRIEVGSAAAAGFGGSLLSRNGVSLDSVSFETTRESPDSSRSRLRVEDLILRPAANLEAVRLRAVLQAMGLSELKLGLDCTGAERRDKRELVIERCALAAADLWDLSFAATLTDADEAFWRAVDDGNAMILSRSSIALASATLMLADKGIVDRSVRALAATTGQSPAVARANLARDIRTYQPPDILITEDLTRLLDTAARFIEQGGTLGLEARPDPPLGLAAASRMNLAAPDLVNLLGLSATLSR